MCIAIEAPSEQAHSKYVTLISTALFHRCKLVPSLKLPQPILYRTATMCTVQQLRNVNLCMLHDAASAADLLNISV